MCKKRDTRGHSTSAHRTPANPPAPTRSVPLLPSQPNLPEDLAGLSKRLTKLYCELGDEMEHQPSGATEAVMRMVREARQVVDAVPTIEATSKGVRMSSVRVYVASKTDNHETVRVVQEELRKYGYEITHDWTKVVREVGGPGLKGTISDEDRQNYANFDFHGVKDCDVLVLLCYPGMCGAYIETGMALALSKPVLIVGTPERDSVFFEMDGVHRVEVREGALIAPRVLEGLGRIFPGRA